MTTNFPKVDGDVLNADEVNRINGKILEVYSGTGFDDGGNHELNAVSAANIQGADYIKVGIICDARATYTGGSSANVTAKIKIESKEIGGAYAVDVNCFVFYELLEGNPDYINVGGTYTWVHTLTAGEKTNGIQFKITSESGGGTTNTFTNHQAVVSLT